jgi:transposase
MLIADKAYDSRAIGTYLHKRRIQSNIPQRKKREGTQCRTKGPKPKFDAKLYKERNVIERLVGWLKNCRRIATRFEKKAEHFLAMIKLTFIKCYLKRHFSDTP